MVATVVLYFKDIHEKVSNNRRWPFTGGTLQCIWSK